MSRFLLLCICAITTAVHAQHPARKALIGLIVKQAKEGVRVDSVLPHGTADLLRIRKGDLLLNFNGAVISTEADFRKAANVVRTGDKVEIALQRINRKFTVKGSGVQRPFEISSLADVSYHWVRFREGYLRAIARKPRGRTDVPCVLLIPGYGCGSIENFSGSYNGRLIDEWLKSGYAVLTIEKSGMGDSYGCAPCADADLATDIESYDAGYRFMESLDFTDRSRLFIWGHSLGGMIAPEVARRHQPAGVMVFGTVFRPWAEFLPEMHRVQKPLLDGMSLPETERFTRLIHKVYYEFFVLKRTRAELAANPEYKSIVTSELEHGEGSNNMWGRHWRFWQQIDSLDLAASWASVKCPVLVINGSTDYEQCAAIEPLLIEKTVNTAHPGHATRVEIPDLDHFMMRSATYEEAVRNFRSAAYMKGNFNEKITDEIRSWMLRQKNRS